MCCTDTYIVYILYICTNKTFPSTDGDHLFINCAVNRFQAFWAGDRRRHGRGSEIQVGGRRTMFFYTESSAISALHRKPILERQSFASVLIFVKWCNMPRICQMHIILLPMFFVVLAAEMTCSVSGFCQSQRWILIWSVWLRGTEISGALLTVFKIRRIPFRAFVLM